MASNIIRQSDLNRLVSDLRKLGNRYQTERTRSVIVGYAAAYAVFVHEAPMKLKGEPRGGLLFSKKTGKQKEKGTQGRFWDPQGRAQNKFLEQPARELQPELRGIIRQFAIRRRSIPEGLVAAGLRLQRASQKLVPVDTGNLKASAFTRLEN